jgi:5-formyltetrahydrofolate cyclo-ligase
VAESVGILDDGSLKAALRAELQARRDALPLDERTAAAETVAGHAAKLLPWPGGVVAAYWPIRSEIDPRPLIAALRAAGAMIALPSLAVGVRLVFRQWDDGDELVEGRFGTREPASLAPLRTPLRLIVPLLGFTRAGDRLGYGAGYYDRSLPALAREGAYTVGLAFAAQEVEQLPREPHDWPLDAVLTEKEWIDCRRNLAEPAP